MAESRVRTAGSKLATRQTSYQQGHCVQADRPNREVLSSADHSRTGPDPRLDQHTDNTVLRVDVKAVVTIYKP